MNFKKLATLGFAAILLTGSIAPSANALTDKEKKEIGEFVRSYLIEHPEIMVDVQHALEKKQQDARMAQAEVAVHENKKAIFDASYDIALGNPKGKITIVEFFDYNCTYCKHAISDMDAIIKTNPDVRFVLKEFPILGEDSVAAHRVSDAFRKLAPQKYADFHRALLGGNQRADEARAIEVAASLGVPEKQIRDEMAKSSNEQSVKDTYKLATKLGITGTPSYVLGDEAIYGAIGAEAIDEKIQNVGQCGKTTC
jgi:protein-disulfide isomerase